ncbi:hypothetical protein [Isoptericola sp. NPDC056605]|uniref:hypothetical protein n=1 Tax=Isoptericola sp. NPDC056605 TaxID=3345876 RepID=UPI0036C65F4E
MTNVGNIGYGAVSNGSKCRTLWYKGTGYSGEWFYMLRALDLSNYKDPYLRNGAGTGKYSSNNFEKQVSSLRFTDCIS